MPSSTNSGASSMRGRPGTSASPMPAITRRIEGAVLNRRATTATTTSTAISSRRVWIVAATDYLNGSRSVCWVERTCARPNLHLTPSLRTDAAHEVGKRTADLIGAVFSQEMASLHCHFALVRPSAAKFSLPADQNRTWIGIDEKLGDIRLREPGSIGFDHFHHIGRLAFDRNHSGPRECRPAVFT